MEIQQLKTNRHYTANCEFAPSLPTPEGQRVPFGWGTVAIDSSNSGIVTSFTWPELEEVQLQHVDFAYFRICVAYDVREEKQIEVILTGSDTVVGSFDIRYGYVHQVFEVPIPKAVLPVVAAKGLSLRMVKGEKPLWVFYDTQSAKISDIHQPHLLIGREGDRLEAFYKQLKSVASIQPFGWLEGCVVDGLYHLDCAFPQEGWRNALLDHLNLYFPTGDILVMEDHFGQISDNTFYLDESTLPIAIIAELWPDHPILDRALTYWASSKHAITAEGCYTMAYPLTALARTRKRTDLAHWAIQLLLERKDQLAEGNGLWQCYRPGSNAARYHNWARAYAWYMLGLTRSLIHLRELHMEPALLLTLEEEIKRVAGLLLSCQASNGLWACYVDDEATGPDTSGSAGIAAALAEGVRHNILPESAKEASVKAFAGLQRYLTPDGLLAGVAQNNRGGEALQRSGYRVISQMAMGLMGQLAAALGRPSYKERETDETSQRKGSM